MKHVLSLCLITLLFAGCLQRYSLKGEYRTSPYAIQVKDPADTAWLRVMDFMNRERIAPRFVKKKTFVIITDAYSFRDDYTNEDASGKPVDTTKYVVLPTLPKGKSGNMSLKNATAHWTIHVQNHSKQTAVLIELSKVTATYEAPDGESIRLIGNNVSTDQFEKKLESFLKHP